MFPKEEIGKGQKGLQMATMGFMVVMVTKIKGQGTLFSVAIL